MENVVYQYKLLIFATSFSQVHKYRATKFICTIYHDTATNNDFEKCDDLIVFNNDTKKIELYGSKVITYDIIRYDSTLKEKDGSETQRALCLDDLGVKCFLYFIQDSDGKSLVIDYSNNRYAYIIEQEK